MGCSEFQVIRVAVAIQVEMTLRECPKVEQVSSLLPIYRKRLEACSTFCGPSEIAHCLRIPRDMLYWKLSENKRSETE